VRVGIAGVDCQDESRVPFRNDRIGICSGINEKFGDPMLLRSDEASERAQMEGSAADGVTLVRGETRSERMCDGLNIRIVGGKMKVGPTVARFGAHIGAA
jgi:hypothetical protein